MTDQPDKYKREILMKSILNLLIVVLILFLFGCEKISQDAVELSVDFSWKGVEQCG